MTGTNDGLFSLDGRTAVVTGAAGLLGRQHALALSAAGATVALADLDGRAARATAQGVTTATGRPAFGATLDVTSRASVETLRDDLLARFGRIDALVNNAALDDKVERRSGDASASRFEDFPEDLFRRVLDVNVTGVFLCCRVLGAAMAANGGGSIVNVASTYGVVAPDQSLYVRPDGERAMWKGPAYPASKGAVLAFTRYLAAYWGAAGVRVNALSPGGVENSQEDWFVEAYARRTPLGRMAGATDYRGALVFLCSDASRYMTGANLLVDGGFTCW